MAEWREWGLLTIRANDNSISWHVKRGLEIKYQRGYQAGWLRGVKGFRLWSWLSWVMLGAHCLRLTNYWSAHTKFMPRSQEGKSHFHPSTSFRFYYYSAEPPRKPGCGGSEGLFITLQEGCPCTLQSVTEKTVSHGMWTAEWWQVQFQGLSLEDLEIPGWNGKLRRRCFLTLFSITSHDNWQ